MKKITLILLSILFVGNILNASTTAEVQAFTNVLKNVCGITNYASSMNATDSNFNGNYTNNINCYNKGLTDSDLNTFKVLNKNDYYLDLSNNNLTNVDGLSNLTTVSVLNLSNNKITDISGLSNLTTAANLILSNNKITDISALSNLTTIINLILLNNNLTNLNGLNNLTTVKGGLDVSNNSLTDISALSNLTTAADLDLSNNNLTNFKDLINLTVSWFYFTNNPITDLTSLQNMNFSNNSYLYLFLSNKKYNPKINLSDEICNNTLNLHLFDENYNNVDLATICNIPKTPLIIYETKNKQLLQIIEVLKNKQIEALKINNLIKLKKDLEKKGFDKGLKKLKNSDNNELKNYIKNVIITP